jgi:hypothetical protein
VKQAVQSRLQRFTLLLALILLSLLLADCRPANGQIKVACVIGNAYSPSPLVEDFWPTGGVKRCQFARPFAPQEEPMLFLCGDAATQAWSVTWLREDIKKSLYTTSREYRINFHSRGHGGGRYINAWWACKKTMASLECY